MRRENKLRRLWVKLGILEPLKLEGFASLLKQMALVLTFTHSTLWLLIALAISFRRMEEQKKREVALAQGGDGEKNVTTGREKKELGSRNL